MRKYWGRITLSALLIFVVGYGIVSAGRAVKNSIVTSKDIAIPLGSFVPFKLNGAKVGTIREIRIRRSEPKVLTGFHVRVRINDSAAFTQLQDCRLSVNDANHFDERTSFVCLASDSGYKAFGEVTAYLADSPEQRTLGLILLLPDAAVQEFQRAGREPDGRSVADSLAEEVGRRARVQSRAYRDSIRADELEQRSKEYQRRADSIRATRLPSTAPPAAPKPL